MKHPNIAIHCTDLINRLENEGVDEIETLYKNYWDDDFEMPNEWWVAIWGESVTCPIFNGDAIYHGPFPTKEEAVNYRDNTIEYNS